MRRKWECLNICESSHTYMHQQVCFKMYPSAVTAFSLTSESLSLPLGSYKSFFVLPPSQKHFFFLFSCFFFNGRKDLYSSNSWYNNDIFRWLPSLVKETVHLLLKQGLKVLSDTFLEGSKQKNNKIFWESYRDVAVVVESLKRKLGRKMCICSV